MFGNLTVYGFNEESLPHLQSNFTKEYLMDRLQGDREKWRNGENTVGWSY